MLVAQVQLPGRARAVNCVSPDAEFEVGEWCLVETGGRLQLASVVRIPLELDWTGGPALPKIIRRAASEDEEREAYQQARNEESLAAARVLVDELGLAMRLVRVQVAPQGRKFTFFFVAEGRVDFRQLVRELTRKLNARVELRQIGVRDAAIAQGGMAHCGHDLCCSRWIGDFAPVSMKMAKAQGLPVNPAKISGQCGRLMCCLRYELEGGGTPCGRPCGGGAGVETEPETEVNPVGS